MIDESYKLSLHGSAPSPLFRRRRRTDKLQPRGGAIEPRAQPSLSSQIRDLEDELGFRLLDRDRYRVALTDAAHSDRGRFRGGAAGSAALERELTLE